MTQTDPFQRGFAAIAAIFLVVILAALGAFMLTFSNTQQLTLAQDVRGTRAYWAARAALEWAVVALPATPALCTAPVAAPPTPIEGFVIAIDCASASYADTGAATAVAPTKIFKFTVTASTGTVGSIGFTERSVSASVEK
jgi:MSHA biogenesis protein MshP